MDMKLEIAFFVFLGVATLLGLFWAVKTETRLKKFFLGKKGRDLENAIQKLESNIVELKQAQETTEKDLAAIQAKLRKSVRGLEILRFNPFPDQGSNQSFAIGMLNEEGDGIVLSSLYSRERMSVFAKPIRAGQSTYDLSKEEKEVLAKARV